MPIEIKDINVLLPALVSYKENNVENTIFVYINQVKLDIMIPDGNVDVEEFKKAFFAKYVGKSPQSPKLPDIKPEELKQKYANNRNHCG